MSKRKYEAGGVRVESAETEDYPGLVVCDGRVTGSITDGHSRLPLWAYMYTLAQSGWDDVADDWPPHELDADKLGRFLHNLLDHRGEFARLICVMADVERRSNWHRPWWKTKTQRTRMIKQLERCLDVLREEAEQPR